MLETSRNSRQKVARVAHDVECPVLEGEFKVHGLHAPDEGGLGVEDRQFLGAREVCRARLRESQLPRPGQRLLQLERVHRHSLARAEPIEGTVSKTERDDRIGWRAHLRHARPGGVDPHAGNPQHRVGAARHGDRFGQVERVALLRPRRRRHGPAGRQGPREEPDAPADPALDAGHAGMVYGWHEMPLS